MSVNIFSGRANVAIAKVSATFVSLGLDFSNISVIYEISTNIISYVPGRGINPLNGFTKDRGYWIVPKIDLDLESVLIPPVPTSTSGSAGVVTSFEIQSFK